MRWINFALLYNSISPQARELFGHLEERVQDHPPQACELASSGAWRGMPADPDPAATGFDDGRMIHMEGFHGGTSDRRETHDYRTIAAPAEVLAPDLEPWMEQSHALPRQGVLCICLGSLELVTAMARHTEVVPHRLATGSSRNDVIDDGPRARDGGQGVTIGTPILGLGDYALAQRPGDAPGAHPVRCDASDEGM